MDPWTCFALGVAVLTPLWDVAHADDDWEERVRRRFHSDDSPHSSNPWSRPRSRFFLPTGAIVSIIIMAMIFIGAVAAICFCIRRNRRMMAMQQPLMPQPMAPATAGATTYGFPGHQPPMPASMMSPVAPYPPQGNFYQQQQAAPYPQEALYADHNIAHVQQPSTIPMPSPTAPPEPPPPYGYQANYPH